MATSYGVGCKNIKVGALAVDGGLSLTLADIGKLYKNTVSLTDDDGSVTKHFAEGQRYPFLNVLEAAGTQIKFALVDISAAILAKWLGGAVITVSSWDGASDSFSVENSVSIDTLFNVTIVIPRCFLYGKITWNMTRTEIAKIEITGEVMQPEKALLAPLTFKPTV
jgi:hypothetical protein